jgi:ferredoxin--NADP+ reductase
VTREPFHNEGRLSDLIDRDQLCARLALPSLSAEDDRVMMCGGPTVLKDMVALLESRGFEAGTSGERGHYVVERAFVEK